MRSITLDIPSPEIVSISNSNLTLTSAGHSRNGDCSGLRRTEVLLSEEYCLRSLPTILGVWTQISGIHTVGVLIAQIGRSVVYGRH